MSPSTESTIMNMNTSAMEAAASLPAMPSWVDRLQMAPLSDSSSTSTASPGTETSDSPPTQNADASNNSNGSLEFNIASLNVLAESYLTPRSHSGLPESYADVVFDPVKRRKLLLDTLEKFCNPSSKKSNSEKNGVDASNIDYIKHKKWDILALQELDLVKPDDPILPAFESWGYQVVRTPTKQRKDCSAIVFDASKFSLINYEVVNFDDLATLQSVKTSEENASKEGDDPVRNTSNNKKGDSVNFHNITPSRTNSPPELTGMVRSFLRRNCGVVAHLKSIQTQQSIIVASVHLYWHPGYEYVKLCQAKYLLDRVASFASDKAPEMDGKAERIPTIICGDMNSKPGSIVHKLFVKPSVDARSAAPWRYFWDEDNEEMYTEDDGNDTGFDFDRSGDGDRKDGQDPIVDETNDLEADGTDSEEQAAGGYMMVGLNSDFTMYCGITDSEANANGAGKSSIVKHEITIPKPTTKNCNPTIDLNPGSNDNGIDHGSEVENEKLPQSTNSEKVSAEVNISEAIDNDDNLKATLAWRRLNKHKTPQDYHHSTPPLPVKYHLDYTLNKFTRWLRILGIDATLETMDEEKERTSGGNIALFDHCKNEQRTLLTTSYKLLLRKDCPPGAYLLDPKSTEQLEQALPRLLRTHGIELSPCTFLTRCVLCNGSIDRVLTDEEKKAVFVDHGAPALVHSEEHIEVFRCDRCGQGYWWDDTPSSSASRVFAQATKLLRLCLRGGVAVKDEALPDSKKRKVVMGAFDFVNVAKERESEETNDTELSVIEWLREDRLSSDFTLRSVYAPIGNSVRKDLPFTNVTKDFVGCLDYIFFEPLHFDQICKLNVPTSFRDMNSSGVARGHLIPSDIWPSDHIAVGARLRLKQNSNKDEMAKLVPTSNVTNKTGKMNTNNSTPKLPHPQKCACGCVPNVLSLFEMAELRKKLREQKAAEAASKLSN